VLEELNVRAITCTQEEGDMVVRSAAPDNTILGRRLGKAFREVGKAIKDLTNADLMKYEREGKLEVAGHELSGDDLKIARSFNGDTETVQVSLSSLLLLLLLLLLLSLSLSHTHTHTHTHTLSLSLSLSLSLTHSHTHKKKNI